MKMGFKMVLKICTANHILREEPEESHITLLYLCSTNSREIGTFHSVDGSPEANGGKAAIS